MQPQQQQRQAQRPRPEPPTLEEIAGIAARRIIRDAGVPDTVNNWRALQRAAFDALHRIDA